MVKDKTDNTQPQTPDMQRRNLLRGLSAVPVVATLTPVSASALSMACTAKDIPELPANTGPVTSGTVSGEYQCLPVGSSGTSDVFNALVDDPFNGSVADTLVYTDTPGTAALGEYTDSGTAQTQQCVIYIDSSSQLTYQSTGNNPIGASCLISLATSTTA